MDEIIPIWLNCSGRYLRDIHGDLDFFGGRIGFDLELEIQKTLLSKGWFFEGRNSVVFIFRVSFQLQVSVFKEVNESAVGIQDLAARRTSNSEPENMS